MNKRITYIHQHYQLPSEGGAMRGWEFTKRLARDGYEVTVIRGRPKEISGDFEGVKVVGVGTPYSNEMSIARRIFAFLQFTARSTVLAVRTPSDIVFATSTPLTVAIPGIIAAFFRRVPFVFEVRDLWPSVPIELGYLKNPFVIQGAKALEKLAYRRSRTVIALSPGMREGVLKVSPDAEVVVVPNAADIEMFESVASQRDEIREQLGWGDKTVVLYAGSFGDIYNIPWIVELAGMCRPFAEFQVIGKGKFTAESERRAEHLGLEGAELLPGSMSKPEVVKRITAADVCLSSVINHSSLEPASINKVFDAMAAGKPILFNHDGWLTELCVRNGAGWRLPNDLSDAASCLSNIFDSPDNLSRASKESKKLSELFSRETLYEEFKRALFSEES